jgi:hypothetical protein
VPALTQRLRDFSGLDDADLCDAGDVDQRPVNASMKPLDLVCEKFTVILWLSRFYRQDMHHRAVDYLAATSPYRPYAAADNLDTEDACR